MSSCHEDIDERAAQRRKVMIRSPLAARRSPLAARRSRSCRRAVGTKATRVPQCLRPTG
jgi:hypothetical protein